MKMKSVELDLPCIKLRKLALLSLLTRLTQRLSLSMLIAKPTVTVVHGAWQPIESWKVFAEMMETLGHETEIVPLPSIDGDETPLPGLREDYEAVAAVLTRQADEGKEIVLRCHSYGGVVGSCAVEGLDLASRKKAGKKGGVLIIVYMSCFMLRKGTSLLEALGGVPAPWMDVQVLRYPPFDLSQS